MATSGVNTYSNTTQQIIKDAFVEATIYRVNSSLPSEDYDFALRKINEIVKGWQVMGNIIWKDKRATLFLQKNQASYVLGSTAHATESFVSTTLSAAAASGAGSISVTSATGMSIGDNIGIVKDSGSLFWTTITNIVSTTITLNANLDGDSASGNTVYTYTTKITKPLNFKEANLVQSDNNEVILFNEGREGYFNLSNKDATGSPTQYYYERRRTDGVLYVWTVPVDLTQYINFTYQPYLDDFINQADEADFPIEWQRALILGLASELCTPYGIGEETYNKVVSKAEYWYNIAAGNDNEDGSLIFQSAKVGR